MRKILTALSLFCSLHLSAEIVPQDKAKQIAENFFRQNQSRSGAVSLRMVYDGETSASRSSGQAPALYVFDNQGWNGFVVVSGDDAAYPILGYSTDGDFPEGQLPANLQSWLEGMKNQVNFLREQGAPTMVNSRAENTGEVVKQLTTAKWNQDTPYDKYTPVISGKQSPTGCTTTAVAIAMHYVKWPKTRTVTLPAYTTETNKINRPAREACTYDWDNMLVDYSSGKGTEAQRDNVANLMADIGNMLKSDYAKDDTGAYPEHIANGLITYMDYDKSMQFVYRSEFNKNKWYSMMKNELDNNRPVIYAGFCVTTKGTSGHSFVLDGYTTQDYFGVNWGWGGYCNGYFRLDAMNPSGSGIGGTDHYNDLQNALIGVQKNVGGEYVDRIVLGTKGFNKPQNIQSGVAFTLTNDGIWNRGGRTFNGYFLWALADKNGNIKEQLVKYSIDNLGVGYGWDGKEYIFNVTLTIKSTLQLGDRIRFYYQTMGATEWTLVEGGDECTWEIIVGDEKSIEETTTLRYERSTGILVVQTKDGVLMSLKDQGGKEVMTGITAVNKGLKIDTNQLPASTYTLKLTKGSELYELKLKMGLAK